jgi:hypothetical protein
MLSFNSYGEIRSEIHINKSGELHGKVMMWMDAELIIDAIYKDGKCVSAKPTARTVKNNNCLLYIDADLEIEHAKAIEHEKKKLIEAEEKKINPQPLHEKARKELEEVYKELEEAQSVYVNKIASKVRDNWRYQAAEDDWSCEVYVVQDRSGNVHAVDVTNCKVDDSSKARSFSDSIERAVYKSTPLPYTSDDSIFDSEIYMVFRAN